MKKDRIYQVNEKSKKESEEKVMRNLKRYGFAIVACMLVVITSIPVFAGSNSRSVQFNGYNAYGTEFISFVSGHTILPDLVSYTVSIVGQDQSNCAMTCRAGTPNTPVANVTLNHVYGYTDSRTNVQAGRSNAYGYVAMDFNNATYEIHATD